jgi:hypothetical protein
MDLLGGRDRAPAGDGASARGIVPCHRAWHVVARAGDELAPTARLFLTHLTATPSAHGDDASASSTRPEPVATSVLGPPRANVVLGTMTEGAEE